jgi:hypothetical protein
LIERGNEQIVSELPAKVESEEETEKDETQIDENP